MSKVLKVRHATIKAFRDHYYDKDYVEVFSRNWPNQEILIHDWLITSHESHDLNNEL